MLRRVNLWLIHEYHNDFVKNGDNDGTEWRTFGHLRNLFKIFLGNSVFLAHLKYERTIVSNFYRKNCLRTMMVSGW